MITSVTPAENSTMRHSLCCDEMEWDVDCSAGGLAAPAGKTVALRIHFDQSDGVEMRLFAVYWRTEKTD